MPRNSRNLSQQLNIRLTPDLLDGLQKMADLSEATPSTIARMAIKREVKKFLANTTVYNPVATSQA